MKKLTCFAVLFTVLLSVSARADDMTIMIKKSSDTMAKVSAVPDKGKASMVPIMFDSGASWDDVKDTYTVSPETASALMDKKETISIGTDGGATFHKKMMKMHKM